jgi:hypothetical protein
MDLHRFDPLATSVRRGLSRRAALGRLGGGGLAAALLATVGLPRRTAAQGGAPAGWRTEHLEVDFTPHDAVSITLAGSGPPQRGDWFYIDAQVYAAGDVNGTQIGTYECFGAWVVASDDTAAPALRLTTVHFRLDDGSLMGLINEFGTEEHVGAVQGGTGSYTGAIGTFVQAPVEPPASATPAMGTPAPSQSVFRATFDIFLPDTGM